MCARDKIFAHYPKNDTIAPHGRCLDGEIIQFQPQWNIKCPVRICMIVLESVIRENSEIIYFDEWWQLGHRTTPSMTRWCSNETSEVRRFRRHATQIEEHFIWGQRSPRSACSVDTPPRSRSILSGLSFQSSTTNCKESYKFPTWCNNKSLSSIQVQLRFIRWNSFIKVEEDNIEYSIYREIFR